MQVGIGIGAGFGAPGVPAVPPVAPARVVFVGASIIEQTFGRNLATPNAARTAEFRAAGLAVDVYGYGVSGANTASIRPRVAEALAAFPAQTLFVIHIGGNNVSATRPYATASLAARNAIAVDYAGLIADIGARKGDVILCPTTFRTYEDTPDIAALPAPRDAVFTDEALGSRPYNDAIFIPAIAAWRPETINTDGNPVVDLYNATRNAYETYVSGDGVHPANPAGRDILAQVMIARLGWAIHAGPVPAPILPRTVTQAAPVNTALPVISGAAQEGQVLTATTGLWTGTPAPSLARQWQRDGVAISGAVGASYLLVAADLGQAISLQVSASNSAGVVSATSAATALVTAAGGTGPAKTLIVNFGNVPAGFLGTTIVANDVRSALNPTRPPVALKHDDGTASPYTLLVAHPAASISNNTYNNNVGGGRLTGVAGYDGTLFNDAIYGSSIFADMVSGPFTLTLAGLVPGAAYGLGFGGSRAATGGRITQVSDGVVTISYDATATPPPAPVSASFVADAAGVITLSVTNPAGVAINTWAYLGGMQVVAG